MINTSTGELLTLNEAFPDGFLGQGIFTAMVSSPFEGIYNLDDLDLMFFSEHGQKPTAPLIDHFYDESLGKVSDTNRTKISALIQSRFKTNWERKIALLGLTYDPIENYNLLETETMDKNVTENTTNSFTGTTVIDQSDSTTQTVDTDASNTTSKTVALDSTTTIDRDNDISSTVTSNKTTDLDNTIVTDTNTTDNTVNKTFGFNSTEGVSDTTSDVTGTVDTTNTTDQTEVVTQTDTTTTTDDITQTDIVDSDEVTTQTDVIDQTQATTGSGTLDRTDTVNNTTTDEKTTVDDEDRSLTRKGNIGVTTTQQMIQQEIELWKWNFITEVFQDIAKMIALSIY